MPTTTLESIKKIFFAVCRIAISLGALALIIFMFRSKLHDVGRILLEAQWDNLIEAFGIFLAAFCVVTYRLKIIMAVQHLAISLKNLFSIGLIGVFFNNLLPSSIGGDAVKAYYAYKITGKKLESFSAIFVDRVLGLFTLIGLASLALIFFRAQLNNPKITDAIIAMTTVSLVVLVFFASRRVAKRFKFVAFLIPSEKFREKLKNLYHSVYGYKQHPGAVATGLLLSLISQSLFIIVNYFLALSLKVSIPIWVFFILVPIIGTVSMAPSLNGLGVREGAYVYLFSHFCTSEQAFALSILNYFILVVLSIAGGLVYVMRKLVLFKEIASVDVIEELSHSQEEFEASTKS
ncbi:MAG: flippase-like domain-containing protein [Candidatus Omnitrophica bacterium]|nr:flippase-like domain-containing protein [Candidatus Omnitrophota bacterium]